MLSVGSASLVLEFYNQRPKRWILMGSFGVPSDLGWTDPWRPASRVQGLVKVRP